MPARSRSARRLAHARCAASRLYLARFTTGAGAGCFGSASGRGRWAGAVGTHVAGQQVPDPAGQRVRSQPVQRERQGAPLVERGKHRHHQGGLVDRPGGPAQVRRLVGGRVRLVHRGGDGPAVIFATAGSIIRTHRAIAHGCKRSNCLVLAHIP